MKDINHASTHIYSIVIKAIGGILFVTACVIYSGRKSTYRQLKKIFDGTTVSVDLSKTKLDSRDVSVYWRTDYIKSIEIYGNGEQSFDDMWEFQKNYYDISIKDSVYFTILWNKKDEYESYDFDIQLIEKGSSFTMDVTLDSLKGMARLTSKH